jgi:hypothetical protein
LQSFLKTGIVRKLAGLANQHKKLVLLGTIGVLLMSTVKPMLMQFSDAQCEDDFKRVEMNYIENWDVSLKSKDNRFCIMIWKYAFIDVDEAKADYKKAAPWLKKLLNSYADGINFYLINILK